MATPVLANIAPSAATIIPSDLALSFELTSSPSLQREMVFVRFPGAGIEEVIWDGSAFTSRYASRSTRVAITGGYKYTVIRTPVWPDSPQIAIYAVNTSAEELTSSWGYTVLDAATYSTASAELPTFAGARSTGPESGFVSHNQSYFLRVAESALNHDYYSGLRAGEGYEVLQQQAAQFARVSEAILNTANGMLAGYARGGAFAEGQVEFYREVSGAGAVTVRAGSVVQSSGGRFFVTLTDAVFGSTDLGPVAANVRAVFQDWQHNVSGQTVTTAGVTVAGEITRIRTMLQSPAFGDPSIRVRQITDVAGGRPPMLDMLALSNGVRRQNRETDGSLSYRIRNLPDNLTPAAVKRNMKILLGPAKATSQFTESWDLAMQTAYDMPPTSPHTNVFVYDDPRPRYAPARNWYADDREQWGTFYVSVSKIQPMRDFGGLYDDAAADRAGLTSSRNRGLRAIGAYDLPDSNAMGDGTSLGMAYDGRDVGQDNLLMSVAEMLHSIRAAGIVAGLQQEGW